jgi:long-chain acyl-CoA synthetase
MNQNIPSLLLEKFKRSPSGKSIGWIEHNKVISISMKEYFSRISEITLTLEELGIKANEKVSILANTSHLWHLYDLASMCLNAVVVPIYPTYLGEEVEFILNHSQATTIVIDSTAQFLKVIEQQDKLLCLNTIISFVDIEKEELDKLDSRIVFFTNHDIHMKGKSLLEQKPERTEELINSVQDNSIASIVYTSGTTGLPKGAIIRHRAFWSMLDNVKTTLSSNIDESDRTLTFLPLSHVLGRCDSMLGLSLGMEIVYAEGIDKIIDNISTAKPTIMIAVPRIFEKIYAGIKEKINDEGLIKQKVFSWAENTTNEYFDYLDRDQSPPAHLILSRTLAYKSVFSKIYERFGGNIRFFVSGGAPLSTDIIRFLRNANLTILEGYGLTETIAPCFLNPVTKQVPGTVGLPLGDTQVSFDDDGEILIKTSALFSGYYENENETKKAFKDEWFRTGDIGELTTDDYLKITDRKKDIIITSGGKNVAPQKIENLMKNRKFISHFMVIGDQKKFLTAIVGIEKESFIKYFDELELKSNCTLEEIAKNQQVRNLIENEITVVNEDLAKFETIKKFYIAPVEFTPESGLLTPSLKLKKKVILKEFKEEIDALYD